MRYRGHRCTVTAKMGAAKQLPFLLLLTSFWLGLISAAGIVVLGHVLMLAGMAGLKLLRFTDYTCHGANHGAIH
jgi:hypothetical protein